MFSIMLKHEIILIFKQLRKNVEHCCTNIFRWSRGDLLFLEEDGLFFSNYES